MVTIHNLEVRLDVEGEGDEAVFVKLFEKYIKLWSRRVEEAKRKQKIADEHRSVVANASAEGA
jgi:hypothetical protein